MIGQKMKTYKWTWVWIYLLFVVSTIIFLIFSKFNSPKESEDQMLQIEIEMGELYYHERID